MKTLNALRFFIGTLIIYLVPVLLGWGLGDLPGYFASAPRTGYAVVVLSLGLGVVYQALTTPEGIRGGKEETGQRVARQTVVKIVIILVMYAGLVLLPFADRRNLCVWRNREVWRWVGLLSVALGFGLVLWSGIVLGRFYSADVTLQKDHHLITTGLYGVLRHPRYLGVLLTTLGMALLFRSWVGLLAFVPMLGVILFRIYDEEALLRQTFGAEWETYCQRSKRLLPYIY
ncbi:MAG TPA: isoprenylcysteine carboxylmethyltransferase family protein [Anaerolineae bacterium]|nr:isoprenylcysteine carboxylmethyltransferase family protein [Anaerolineae bacterium]HQH39369.1 isoprenylcysteine carboxylmethyltransferase family protein [Anaerolineae bacterium]